MSPPFLGVLTGLQRLFKIKQTAAPSANRSSSASSSTRREPRNSCSLHPAAFPRPRWLHYLSFRSLLTNAAAARCDRSATKEETAAFKSKLGLKFEDEREFRSQCASRAEQGYNSGMGEIFRRVAAIAPVRPGARGALRPPRSMKVAELRSEATRR